MSNAVSEERQVISYDPLERQKREFLEMYMAMDLNVQRAARAVGWNTKRVNELLDIDDDFVVAMNEIREEAVSVVESKAFSRAIDGDPTMIQFVLKHNKPGVYNPAIKVDVTKEDVLVIKDFSGNIIADPDKNAEQTD
jgi:hypothetical protein